MWADLSAPYEKTGKLKKSTSFPIGALCPIRVKPTHPNSTRTTFFDDTDTSEEIISRIFTKIFFLSEYSKEFSFSPQNPLISRFNQDWQKFLIFREHSSNFDAISLIAMSGSSQGVSDSHY